MSIHTDLLRALGEYKLNQWLAVGVKLGSSDAVDKLLACSQLTCHFGDHGEPGVLTDDVDAAIAAKLRQAVSRHSGVVEEDYPLLAQAEGDGLIDSFARLLVAFGASQRNAYVVPVDYDLAWSRQIEAASDDLDWITEYDDNLIRRDPTEHLVQVPTGQIEQRITLVDPEGCVTTEEILAKMDRTSLRPTVSAETLAFTKAHPDVQRKNPLIGLGSVWVDSLGGRGVLVLCGGSGERGLSLFYCESRWPPSYRFLAARKD